MEFGVKFKAIFFASVFLLTLAYLFGRDWLQHRELAKSRPKVEQVIRDDEVILTNLKGYDHVTLAYRESDGGISAEGVVKRNEDKDYVEQLLRDSKLPYGNEIVVNYGKYIGGNGGTVSAPGLVNGVPGIR